MTEPLVSVGLPTYNRAALLERAVASVLAQDYANIELVISDNASTDATPAVCAAARARDARVRVVRQPANIGAVANFHAVLGAARGAFFLWLGDDDWLDPGYVRACLDVLLREPDHALVCGRANYVADDTVAGDASVGAGISVDLPQRWGAARVLAYYRAVEDNGTFYGIMRREQIARVPAPNAPGGDWLQVAALGFLGKIKTLPSVCVHRRMGGVSRDLQSIAEGLGLGESVGRSTRAFYAEVAGLVFRDIAWRSPVYRSLGPGRLLLGLRAAAIVRERFIGRGERARYLRHLSNQIACVRDPKLQKDLRGWLLAHGGSAPENGEGRERRCYHVYVQPSENDAARTEGNDASFVRQEIPEIPSGLRAGRSFPISLTLRNTGTTTWTAADQFRIGSQEPPDNTTWGIFRALLPARVCVPPGATARFSVLVSAPPTPGVHSFRWQMLQEGAAWFGEATPPTEITVGPAAGGTLGFFGKTRWLITQRIRWESRAAWTRPLWMLLARRRGIPPPPDHRFDFATAEEARAFARRFDRDTIQ